MNTETAEVMVETGDAALPGDLGVPGAPCGLVLFAHGSGSSRQSPRNRFVAAKLREAGLATLLFDLLSPAEHAVDQRTAEYRFDIPRLTRRLADAVGWAHQRPSLAALRIGLFGSSTGAAAALSVAAERAALVAAVVSRGGRPDLAGAALPAVHAPTLLIVGGLDRPVIEMNREAAARLGGEYQIEIVPDATHLFEEPGKLEEVAQLAADWFRLHLSP